MCWTGVKIIKDIYSSLRIPSFVAGFLVKFVYYGDFIVVVPSCVLYIYYSRAQCPAEPQRVLSGETGFLL